MFSYFDYSDILYHVFKENKAIKQVPCQTLQNTQLLIDVDFLNIDIQAGQNRFEFFKQQKEQQENKIRIYLQGNYHEGGKKDYQALYQVFNGQMQIRHNMQMLQTIQGSKSVKEFSKQYTKIKNMNSYLQHLQSFEKDNQSIKKCICNNFEVRRCINSKEYQMLYEYNLKQKQSDKKLKIFGKAILFLFDKQLEEIVVDIEKDELQILDINLLSKNLNVSINKIQDILFWCLLIYLSDADYISKPLFCYAVESDLMNFQKSYTNILQKRYIKTKDIISRISDIKQIQLNPCNIIKIAKYFKKNPTKIFKDYEILTNNIVYDECKQTSYDVCFHNGKIQVQKSSNFQKLNIAKYYCILPTDYFSYSLPKESVILFQNYFYLYPSKEYNIVQGEFLQQINDQIILSFFVKFTQPLKIIVKQFGHNYHLNITKQKIKNRKQILKKLEQFKIHNDQIQNQQNKKLLYMKNSNQHQLSYKNKLNFQNGNIDNNDLYLKSNTDTTHNKEYRQQSGFLKQQIQNQNNSICFQQKEIFQAENFNSRFCRDKNFDITNHKQRIENFSAQTLQQVTVELDQQYQKQNIQFDIYYKSQKDFIYSNNKEDQKAQNFQRIPYEHQNLLTIKKNNKNFQVDSYNEIIIQNQQNLNYIKKITSNKKQLTNKSQKILQIFTELLQKKEIYFKISTYDQLMNISFSFFLQQIQTWNANIQIIEFVKRMKKKQYLEESVLFLIFLQKNFINNQCCLSQNIFTQIKPQKGTKKEKNKMSQNEYFQYLSELFSDKQIDLFQYIKETHEQQDQINRKDQIFLRNATKIMWKLQTQDVYQSKIHEQEFVNWFMLEIIFLIQKLQTSQQSKETLWEELVLTLMKEYDNINYITLFFSFISNSKHLNNNSIKKSEQHENDIKDELGLPKQRDKNSITQKPLNQQSCQFNSTQNFVKSGLQKEQENNKLRNKKKYRQSCYSDLRCQRLSTLINALRQKSHGLLLSNIYFFSNSFGKFSLKKLQKYYTKLYFTNESCPEDLFEIKKIMFLSVTIQWLKEKNFQNVLKHFKDQFNCMQTGKYAIQQTLDFLFILKQKIVKFDCLLDLNKELPQILEQCVCLLVKIKSIIQEDT